jgi:hypothetical protein
MSLILVVAAAAVDMMPLLQCMLAHALLQLQ